MQKFLVASMLACAVSSAAAQTKISGTISCPTKPAVNAVEAVSDAPGHMLMLQKAMCSWSKPMTIAGAKSTTEVDVSTGEVKAGVARQSGFGTTLLDNGDTLHVAFEGKGAMKQDGSGTSNGSWHFTSGTGKVKGVKGGGDFKATIKADGSAEVLVTGSYSMAGAKTPAKKEKK